MLTHNNVEEKPLSLFLLYTIRFVCINLTNTSSRMRNSTALYIRVIPKKKKKEEGEGNEVEERSVSLGESPKLNSFITILVALIAGKRRKRRKKIIKCEISLILKAWPISTALRLFLNSLTIPADYKMNHAFKLSLSLFEQTSFSVEGK